MLDPPGAGVQDGPEDDGDEEGIRYYGGVVEKVQGLERAREASEKRCPRTGVSEGMDRCEEEVKGLFAL